MNTTENNKLLAEFMGFEKETDPTQRFYGNWFTQPTTAWGIRLEVLHFDTDWNWLMQVVEKIDEVCGIDLHEWDEHINNALCSKSLPTTYNACVEFIKWYNEQNK